MNNNMAKFPITRDRNAPPTLTLLLYFMSDSIRCETGTETGPLPNVNLAQGEKLLTNNFKTLI